MRKLYAKLSALGLLWLCSAVAAEELALVAECARCHGEQGQSLEPEVPILAGLSARTFLRAMEAYQKNQRPPHEIEFKPYNAEELERMAAFFAAREFIPAEQEADAEMAARGRRLHLDYCEKCHENQGRVDKRGVGILAGQWIPYLRRAMSDYRNRRRDMPPAMQERLDAMFEARGIESLEEVVQYYGSLAR
jgi:sulfide dehydrogenase cytochrome subunit